MGASWRAYYESENFVQEIDELWSDVKPLYDELHTYVLNKLKEKYPQLKEKNDNLIPAHILGKLNMEKITDCHELFQKSKTI